MNGEGSAVCTSREAAAEQTYGINIFIITTGVHHLGDIWWEKFNLLSILLRTTTLAATIRMNMI